MTKPVPDPVLYAPRGEAKRLRRTFSSGEKAFFLGLLIFALGFMAGHLAAIQIVRFY